MSMRPPGSMATAASCSNARLGGAPFTVPSPGSRLARVSQADGREVLMPVTARADSLVARVVLEARPPAVPSPPSVAGPEVCYPVLSRM